MGGKGSRPKKNTTITVVRLKETPAENDAVMTAFREGRALSPEDLGTGILDDFFNVPYDEIEIVNSVGKGGGGAHVYKAVWNAQEIAFKCWAIGSEGLASSVQEFMREARMFQKVRHTSILTVYGCTIRPPRCGILMEYCGFGDLENFFHVNGRGLPMKTRIRLLCEVAAAVAYLHEHNIIHRDLKLANVLVSDRVSAKLMDFGISRVVQRMSATKTAAIGTPQYMAPEMMDGHYSEKVDVYSFAIVLYMALTGKRHIFGEERSFRAHLMARHGDRPSLLPISKRKDLGPIAESMCQLVGQMWDMSPDQRPAMAAVRDKLKEFLDDPLLASEDEPEDITVAAYGWSPVREDVRITLYIRREGERDEDAEDVDFRTASGYKGLQSLVSKLTRIPTKSLEMYILHGKNKTSLRKNWRAFRSLANDDMVVGKEMGRGRNRRRERDYSSSEDDLDLSHIRVLIRWDGMPETEEPKPGELSDLSVVGLRKLCCSTLHIREEQIERIQKETRGRLLYVTKDASVLGIQPDTVILVSLVEGETVGEGTEEEEGEGEGNSEEEEGEDSSGDEGIQLLFRTNQMPEGMALPYTLKNLTIGGLKKAASSVLGIPLKEIQVIKKMTRVGLFKKVTVDASVIGLQPRDLILAVKAGDEQEEEEEEGGE